MKNLVVVLASIILLLGVANARAIPHTKPIIDAPIGLKWGMNKSEVESQVESLSVFQTDKYNKGLITYDIKNPKKTVDGIDDYSVTIDENYGLVVAEMLQYIVDDKGGIKIRERYNIIKSALTNKYGTPNSQEYINDNNIDFYECLSKPNCGNMLVSYSGENGVIYLRINSTGYNSGNVYIFYKTEKYDEIKKKAKDDVVKGMTGSL